MLMYGIGYVDGSIVMLWPGYGGWMIDLAWGVMVAALTIRLVRAVMSLIP